MRSDLHGGEDLEATLLRIRSSVTAFVEWFEGRVAPRASAHPLVLESWQKELSLISGLVEKPDRVRIALVGTTGAGKSTFLNAVLGQELLPIGVMAPCTAFVTSVRHSGDDLYHATTEFCSREDWNRDLALFCAALQPGDQADGSNRAEERKVLEAARKRAEAVYGVKIETVESAQKLSKRPFPPEVQRIFDAGGREEHHFEDAKGLSAYLKNLVRGSSALWPLIAQVSVSGPYESLAGGVELVDLPGLNDPNAARVEVTREFLRTSPFVWVVFSMVRGITEDIQRVLREEKLLRLLTLSGSLGALSMVGTKADDIDVNVADQFGLASDCGLEELVSAYREQTMHEVRKQLEEMIRDLSAGTRDSETLEGMVAMAREVTVHATSANAYMRLRHIGNLRRDFGIENIRETGIPGIHAHLDRIGREAGTEFCARAADLRLKQLREEITFFFRAQAQRPTAQLQEARARIQERHVKFKDYVDHAQEAAADRLKLNRERFLGDLDPLLEASVRGVARATQDWEEIQWATLRAIAHRYGVFRSPTTGRSFDLNADLAEPLLAQLPVTWERYFTQDLDRVSEGFITRLTEQARSFCDQVRTIVELTFHRRSEGVEEQLKWFTDKIAVLAQEASGRVRAAVRERRSELAAKMPLVAQSSMRPAYEACRDESGRGMKRRILDCLQPRALESARPIYHTIQVDLVEGLNDLEAIILGMFRSLAQAGDEQARIVAHNANIDVDSAAQDPDILGLLRSMPEA